MQEEKIRYYFVDGIRGVAIINMVIFHFLYDVYIVYEKSPTWYSLPAIHIWQQTICCTFIFISGFVWVWGKEKNLRRGIIFNLLGLLISIITLVVIPAQTIWCKSGFCLYHNYLALSIISINLHLLVLLKGRVSIIRTVSPIWHSFFSS